MAQSVLTFFSISGLGDDGFQKMQNLKRTLVETNL
jgi:hypothetical protein